jgi:hypothetical protein
MATVQSPGTRAGYRTAQPRRLRQITEASTPKGSRLDAPAGFSLDDLSPEEYLEIQICDEFLADHIRPDSIRDVQCMLLWSEWVRSYQRRTRTFPKRILEEEFRKSVTGRFGIGIACDDHRGAVYPGLRFVP